MRRKTFSRPMLSSRPTDFVPLQLHLPVVGSLLPRFWSASRTLRVRTLFGRSSVLVRCLFALYRTEQRPKNDRRNTEAEPNEKRRRYDREAKRVPGCPPELAWPLPSSRDVQIYNTTLRFWQSKNRTFFKINS